MNAFNHYPRPSDTRYQPEPFALAPQMDLGGMVRAALTQLRKACTLPLDKATSQAFSDIKPERGRALGLVVIAKCMSGARRAGAPADALLLVSQAVETFALALCADDVPCHVVAIENDLLAQGPADVAQQRAAVTGCIPHLMQALHLSERHSAAIKLAVIALRRALAKKMHHAQAVQ